MKGTNITARMTVALEPKVFALCVTIIDQLWGGAREKVVRQLAKWYGVTSL